MRSPVVNYLRQFRLAVVLVSLVMFAAAPIACAIPSPNVGSQGATSLWPRLSTPNTVFVVNAHGLKNADQVTATTLQGIYNAAQKSSRLYLNYQNEDSFWLTQLPKSIKVITLPPPGNESRVDWLLQRFRSVIKGAIVTNPSNHDTVNLATTMAGLDQAVVINPSQESMVTALGIPVLYSFDTPEFTADTPAETYEWGVNHLLAKTSTRILTMLNPTHGGDRDYAVAAKSFVFYLTSTNAQQRAVFAAILKHTPPNTPIMGYVPNENRDVAFLSSNGHFLNASDDLSNGSIWASMPVPSALKQVTEPAAIRAQPYTVYVAFLVSDGDNAQYMENRMAPVWQMSNLGSVPEGWTVAPGSVNFAPTLLEYFYRNLPKDSELDSGTSGIGYISRMNGSDLTAFAQLSGQIMQRDDLKTMYTSEPLGNLNQLATESNVPSIITRDPLLEKQIGNTVAAGQTSGYIKTAKDLFCTIHQQSDSLMPGQPLFLEPKIDAWTLTPTNVLNVAQQLALAGQSSGISYVFTTPTELALTMKHYFAEQEAGLPVSNVQSMTGAQLLAQNIVSPSYMTYPIRITGANLVANPSGASGTAGWGTSGGSVSATTYQGKPALHWKSTQTIGETWVHYTTNVQANQTYTFTVDVSGSGQVFMDVYTGSDWTTVPVNLTSAYQQLTWTATIPANRNTATLQVREGGAGPVSVYLKDASITASTSPCS